MDQVPVANDLQPKPNGHAGQTVVLTKQQAEAQVEQFLGPMFACILRGAAGSLPGIPPQLVMAMACRCLGTIVGATFSGPNAPLAPLLMARKECKEEFDKAVANVKPNNPGGAIRGGPIPPMGGLGG